MKEQISTLYAEYGRYINKFRAFPLITDGLKIVERRLLYSLFEAAKDKYVKSAKVVGHCIGQYHPHGDQSAYGSLAALVNGGLANGQGNWGIDVGIDPCRAAAMRYTETKSASSVLDMMFEYIKYVDKEELELEAEPVFLPTKLPVCLINSNYCQGIGFGRRTIIPSYSIPDLVKRLRWLLKYDEKEPIIKPITDCKYLSKKEDFRLLLTTGQAKLDYRGVANIDHASKSVIVTAIPPNKSFAAILRRLEKEIEITKTIGFIDESTNKTKVRFTSLRRSMKLDQLAKRINANLTSSISFECNMCDLDGRVVLISIDQMLLNVYKNYESIVKKVLIDTISKLQNSIDELGLIARIKKVLPKWLKSNPDDSDIVMDGIHQDTGIDRSRIKELFDKYTLSRILKIKTDTENLRQQKNQQQEHLDNLASYVWSEKFQQYL